jgi:SH2 domain
MSLTTVRMCSCGSVVFCRLFVCLFFCVVVCLFPYSYLHGFLSRENVEAALSGMRPGSFLMRFSERHPGSIAIAYM